jgi:hypothetical protein
MNSHSINAFSDLLPQLFIAVLQISRQQFNTPLSRCNDIDSPSYF